MYSVRSMTLGFVFAGVMVLMLSGVVVADVSGTTSVDGETTSLASTDNATDQVIVFFESTDHSERNTSLTELQTHAADTQAEFLSLADRTDGVDIVTEFWITSAVLVEVNHSLVDIERLATENGAVTVRENSKVGSDSAGVRSIDTPRFEESRLSADARSISPSQNTEERPPPVVNPDDHITASSSPTPTTYGLEMIDAPRVWTNYDTTGEGTTVAVLDSGIEPEHPDIDLYTEDPDDPTYPGGWAEFDDEGNEVTGSTPFDSGSHGTHVSGTVAGGNASGTHVGAAPGVRLIHGKVADGQVGTIASVLAGMEWAMDNDADIVTMSLGSEPTPVWIEPVETLVDAGIVVVTSSGNTGDGTTLSPGNLYSVIGTGAVNEDRHVPSFSSGEEINTTEMWGAHAPPAWPDTYVVPTVTAPGVRVTSTVPSGYGDKDGTSMAAPHVAGGIALMKSASPNGTDLSPETVQSVLRATATEQPSQPNTRYGSGIINAFGAAMYVNDDALLSGTIVDETGEPIENASVTIGNRTTTTDEDGEYELLIDVDATELTVSAFGHETEHISVDADPGQSVTRNAILPSVLDVEVIDNWSHTVSSGNSTSTTVRVANLESAVVSIDPSSTAATDRLNLTIDGDPASFDEPQTYTGLRSDSFALRIETAKSSVGTVSLNATFAGGERSRYSNQTIRISPTRSAVAIPDQESDGTSVEIGASYHQVSSTIGVYLDDDGKIGDRIGVSESLAGNTTHENVDIDLSEPLTENTTVHAVVLENGSQVTISGEPVSDRGSITIDPEADPKHASGVSKDLFDAVDRDGTGDLSREEIRAMIRDYARFGTVEGIPIDRADIRSLIRWYAVK